MPMRFREEGANRGTFDVVCEAIDLLSEGPISKSELMNGISLSSKDADELLGLFEERGLVRQTKNRWELTRYGFQSMLVFSRRRAAVDEDLKSVLGSAKRGESVASGLSAAQLARIETQRSNADNNTTATAKTSVTGSELKNAKKRAQLEIRMDTLKAVSVGRNTTTQILYAANLSWVALDELIETLKNDCLIKESAKGSRKAYELTSQGSQVLASYENLVVNQHQPCSREFKRMLEVKP